MNTELGDLARLRMLRHEWSNHSLSLSPTPTPTSTPTPTPTPAPAPTQIPQKAERSGLSEECAIEISSDEEETTIKSNSNNNSSSSNITSNVSSNSNSNSNSNSKFSFRDAIRSKLRDVVLGEGTLAEKMKQVTTKMFELAARPEVKERVAASNAYRNLCVKNDCPDKAAFSLSIAVCIAKDWNLADNWEWQVNDIKSYGNLRFGRGNDDFWATKGVDADKVRLGSIVLSSALSSIEGFEYALKWASTNRNGEPTLSPAVALGMSLTNKVECGNSEPTLDQCEMFGVTRDVIMAKCKSCKLTKKKFIAFFVRTSGVQVSERSERALMKTSILAKNPAKWLQTAHSTT